MKKRGWQQADLARKSKVAESTLSRILNGERGAGTRVARRLAHAFGVDEDVVLYRSGAKSRDPGSTTEGLDPVALDILQMLENRSDAEKTAALAALTALFDSFDRGLDGQDRRGGKQIIER